MKIKANFNKILWVLAALLLSLFCVFESALSINANAEESVSIRDYSKTKIEDDLASYNIALYPKLETDIVEVICFQEYCYSPKAFFSDYYGLYLYVYNPTENPFKTTGNLVNIATTYDKSGVPSAYGNMSLTDLDSTDNNRFYKFKITQSSSLYEMAKTYEETYGKRRYDVVGFEFSRTDGVLVTKQKDVVVGKTYYYTGFSAGCAENVSITDNVSTLKCESERLEVLNVKVEHTNYLTGDKGGSSFTCDNLHTVYFSIPEKYFEMYGDLQKIKAEWYEYKTAPIFVTSDSKAVTALKPYVGRSLTGDANGENIGALQDGLNWRVVWDKVASSILANYEFYSKYNTVKLDNAELFEGEDGSGAVLTTYSLATNAVTIPRMSWLFERANVTSNTSYSVTSSELLAYAKAFVSPSNTYIRDKYAVELFDTYGTGINSIDAERVQYLYNSNTPYGYVCQEIDKDELGHSILKKDPDQSKWNEFWHGAKYEEESYTPIVTLSSEDTLSSMDAMTFGSTYYINHNDAQTVLDYAKNNTENGNRVVLFRFAKTNYTASTARFDEKVETADELSGEDGYVAQETVFLDFNVISLTFRDALRGDTIIGIVTDPVDVFSGTEAPGDLYEEEPLWKIILQIFMGLFAVLFLLWLISPLKFVFGSIFKVAGWVLCLPFRLIDTIFSVIGKLFKKK